MQEFFRRKTRGVFLAGVVLSFLAASISAQNMFRKVNDFDGDGKSDLAVIRSENGQMYWYVLRSTEGYSVFPFGAPTDTPVAGDYDGDGKTDYAIYRRTLFNSFYIHEFWIQRSSNNTVMNDTFSMPQQYGGVPFSQPYAGGNTAYTAVLVGNAVQPVETKRIYVRNLATLDFSAPGGYTPVRVGDLSGDGKADLVSYNPANYNVSIRNSATGSFQTLQFGIAGDVFIPADFDGDGRGELAIWRNSDGNWWWLRSSDNTVQAAHWGAPGDIPIPGDYDGDGKTDLAIYRPGAQGYYWINGTTSGVQLYGWGVAGDTPISY